jgi:hypothetical protein
LDRLTGYKTRKVASCLSEKLGISFRDGKELVGWYVLDGRKQLRVQIPKGHTGDVSTGYMRQIVNNLRLDREEFRLLYECPMKGSDYEKKIRDMLSL